MNLLLLVVCCMISTSLAGRIDKEAKLETVLNEVEEILQHLKADDVPEPIDDVPEPIGDIQKLESILNDRKPQAVLNGAVIEGDISPKPSHKQDSQGSPTTMEKMLLYTENIDEATAEVEAAGGHILLQLGHNLLVAKVSIYAANQNSFSQASTHIPSSASAETLTHANAYWMAREDELKPQPTAQKWTEKTAPMAIEREDSNDFHGDSPYSSTMTGKIAVVVFIASGPGSLEITDAELQTIISKCQVGLDFWSEQARKNSVPLSFVLYWAKATITVPNPTSCSSFSACHNVFADASLQAFGFPAGRAGKDQLSEFAKSASRADGAFLAFFTKYRQGHFAYAYFGGGPTYMQYSNDGWGTNQIDRVFAHETGHVFNAPDEYGRCKCTPLYGRGSCTATNANCRDCTSSQANCIMDRSAWELCENTKKHVGWC